MDTPTRRARRRRPGRRSTSLALVLSMLATACSSGSDDDAPPPPPPPSEFAKLAMANESTGSNHEFLLDGRSVATLGPGEQRVVDVRVGTHDVAVRFAGSRLPACPTDSQVFATGRTYTYRCSADCRDDDFGGITYANGSKETRYDVRYGGRTLATVDPGEQTDVLRVPAGFDRLEVVATGSSTVLCGGTVTTNVCTVHDWACDNDLCEIRGTGKVRVRNGYAVQTILELGNAAVQLAPNQVSEPLTLPAGQVFLRMRSTTGTVLCSGNVDVVLCETETYVCEPQ